MQIAETKGAIAHRAGRLAVALAALLAAGAMYTAIVLKLHVGLCCPFERITGYLCPGCGISGMFLNIFQGDLREAFLCNPLTFCLMPALLALAGYMMYRYVRYGNQTVPKWINRAAIITAVVYVVWGIARNIPDLLSII